MLETRVLLAATNPFELSSLLAANGGTGATGFAINGVAANDNSGRSMQLVGDVNGDGLDDLLIGAPLADPSLNYSAGASYLVFGTVEGTQASLNLSSLNGTTGFVFNGIVGDDRSGFVVSGAGDVNGDGFDDLLIGAYFADPNGSKSGQSYLVFGGASNLSALDGVTTSGGTAGDGQINLTDLNGSTGFLLNGVAADDRSGRSVSSAGDVNGDGFDDLLIGAYLADPNSKENSGQSYLVFGGTSNLTALDGVTSSGGTAGDGRINLADLTESTGFVLNGINASNYAGSSVSGAGDVNGDGFDDLLIGASGADPNALNCGQSYVVFGGTSNLSALDDLSTANDGRINLGDLTSTTGFVFNGLDNFGDQSGAVVSGVGDVNGDGFDDLLIGASYANSNDLSNSGQSYLVFGGTSNLSALDGVTNSGGTASDGRINLADLNGTTGFVFNGTAANDLSSFAVSGAGDVNGDGFDDLVIGAMYADPNGMNSGRSYVLFGGSSNLTALDGATGSGGTAGDGRINLADVNGTTGFMVNGIAAYDYAGVAVSSAGDVNGDGFSDLLIGARNADLNGQSSGQSYVVFGGNFTGGAETQIGTSAANTLTGSAAFDVLIGGRGDDLLLGNGGLDVLTGGAGDDILAITSTTFAQIDGGNGSDTLRLDGSGMTLNLVTLADNQLTNLETIDITGSGNNTLTLNMQEVLNVTQSSISATATSSNTLLVRRNKGDDVNLGEAWLLGTNETIGGIVFYVYTQGAATLKVQDVYSEIADPPDPPDEPESSDVPDIVLNSVIGNGRNRLTVRYQILNSDITGPLSLRFLRSTDLVASGDDATLSTVTINKAADLTVGSHQLTFTIGSQVLLPGAGRAETGTDHFILAVADPINAIAESDTDALNEDNTVAFVGAYTTSATIHLHGGSVADTVTLTYPSNRFGNVTLGITGSIGATYTYAYRSTAQFRMRTHGGGDSVEVVNLSELHERPMLELGGDGDDLLFGASAADTLNGGEGDDTLRGRSGNDSLNGGSGSNTLKETGNVNFTLTNSSLVGLGTDALANLQIANLTGGRGENTFNVSGWTGIGTLTGAEGRDQITAGRNTNMTLTNTSLVSEGFGTLTLTGIETANLGGGDAANKLIASQFTLGSVTLRGGGGDDVLIGGSKGDLLIGGIGRDLLIGGAGADVLGSTLNGTGMGDDILIGGTSSHSSDAALNAIMAEWTSENSYELRVSNLLNSGGLNGSTVLNNSTVQNDSLSADKLTGGSEIDWFFRSTGDILIDFQAIAEENEIETSI